MRVVFLEDVPGVAQGGDVKEVKPGFGRNYLIPKNLAVPATHDALQRVKFLKGQAESGRIKHLTDMRAVAQALDGVQVNIAMKVGAGDKLYGSVTNTMIAEELSKLAGKEIDRRTVQIGESIRRLGLFDVTVRLHAEVDAKIKVQVYASGTELTPPSAEAAAEANVEAGAAPPTEEGTEAGDEEQESQ